MFDFDIGKLMVVAIVALAVIPPKDLPRVMRTVGQVLGKMRRMAAEFQGQFMDAMREADLENVRKELNALGDQAKIDAKFDPAGMIRDDIKAAERSAEIGAAPVALSPPGPAPVARHETPAGVAADLKTEADLEDVRKELEALNEKARAAAPHDAGTSSPAAAPPPQASPAEIEAPSASQSAAE